MEYSLKDKIEVTAEFLNGLITKNWQETEAIQRQIANIDTSTQLGAEVARVLKNTCTNHYVLIGCLERLAEGDLSQHETMAQYESEAEGQQDSSVTQELSHGTNVNADFEPFEYFVDFDEPSGEPITDKDLYS